MIESFVTNKLDKYKDIVKIKPSRGARPYIKLRDDKNKYGEKISVENWKTDDFEDFLQQKFAIKLGA